MEEVVKINPDIELLQSKYFKGFRPQIFTVIDEIGLEKYRKLYELLNEWELVDHVDNLGGFVGVFLIVNNSGKLIDKSLLRYKDELDENKEINDYLKLCRSESKANLIRSGKSIRYPIEIKIKSKQGVEILIKSDSNIWRVLRLLESEFLDYDFPNVRSVKLSNTTTQRRFVKESVYRIISYLNDNTKYKAIDEIRPTDKACEIIYGILAISGMIANEAKSQQSTNPQYIRSIIQKK